MLIIDIAFSLCYVSALLLFDKAVNAVDDLRYEVDYAVNSVAGRRVTFIMRMLPSLMTRKPIGSILTPVALPPP